jgi:hypothetical protein
MCLFSNRRFSIILFLKVNDVIIIKTNVHLWFDFKRHLMKVIPETREAH